MRLNKRANHETRKISFETDINLHAEGSCLVSCGNTKIICTASHSSKLPKFLSNKKQGWITAEYGMLPRSTHSRMNREAAFGKQSGRTQEIQRLIGRSLRAAVDLKKLGENQITIDCDVIQADGGTRTAAISGGFVALSICINNLIKSGLLRTNPIKANVAAISCGIWQDNVITDLDYNEDSNIDVDANFVFNSNKEIIEIQASAEGEAFNYQNLSTMHDMAYEACEQIFTLQNEAIAE